MAAGGRRAGSGQHPGHRFEKRHQTHSEAVLGAFNDAAVYVPPRKVAGVSISSDDPRLLKCAVLAAQGHNWNRIEAETGHAVETIHRWRDAYPEVFEREARANADLLDPRAALRRLIPRTIAVQERILEGGYAKPETELAAAIHAQAYVWDRPTNRTNIEAAVSVSISFGSLPTDPEPEYRPSTIEGESRELLPDSDDHA